MAGRFDGKVVLVTGGTRGIGRACAERFLAEGARVAICGRDAERAAAVAAELGNDVFSGGCEVTDAASVEQLVKAVEEHFGRIDVLVNNAGISREGLLVRMKDEDWDAVIQTNLSAAFYFCRAAARNMIRNRYGRIINISSVLGVRGQAGQTNYCASKAGIIGFTKAYAREVGGRNITVNAVAPGYTDTDMTAGMTDAMVQGLLSMIPLGRAAQPAEIASATAFLASDEAAYITGTVLHVDGGFAM